MSKPTLVDILSDARFRILHALFFVIVVTFVDYLRLSPVLLAMAVIITLLIPINRAILYGVSPLKAAKRSAIVLPLAAMVALFAPLAQVTAWSTDAVGTAYAQGWPVILDILFKAYAAAFFISVVMNSMSTEEFIGALEKMRLPAIFIMLFTFLYRFTDLFRDEIRIMRDAARSRAPHLHGWRLLAFYGRMSGNLFVRAYERGEQVYAAMVSRGYDGTLPRVRDCL